MKPIDGAEDSGEAHFVAVVDRLHVRIFQETSAPGQARRGLRLVEAIDMLGSEFAADGGSKERLPTRREDRRRLAADVAGRLSEFFRVRREASWDLAVAKGMYHQVIDQIEAPARVRLRRALAKDLTNQPPDTFRDHFAAAALVAAR